MAGGSGPIVFLATIELFPGCRVSRAQRGKSVGKKSLTRPRGHLRDASLDASAIASVGSVRCMHVAYRRARTGVGNALDASNHLYREGCMSRTLDWTRERGQNTLFT